MNVMNAGDETCIREAAYTTGDVANSEEKDVNAIAREAVQHSRRMLQMQVMQQKHYITS